MTSNTSRTSSSLPIAYPHPPGRITYPDLPVSARRDDILAALREARRVLQEDAAFDDLDFSARGELLKSIVADDVLLERCARAFREGALTGLLGEMLGRRAR